MLLLFISIGCQASNSREIELAQQLYAELDYTSWSQPQQVVGLQESNSPHGPTVQIWWNEKAENQQESAFSEGATIIEESYFDSEGSKLRSLLVMSKQEMYNDAKKWFWVSYDSTGIVEQAGEPDFCISCHAASDDFILFRH